MANNQANNDALAMLSADIQQNITNAELGLGDKYFPIDKFRPCVQRILNAVSYDYDCHRDKAVMAAMVTVCGTVGKKATLVTPKYRNHPQLFGVLVDRPGGVKSIVNNYFLKPLEQLNRNARERYNRKRREVLAENKDGAIPAPSLYMTKDVTIERLKELITTSNTGIMEYHDELAGMFANFGKYSKGIGSEFESRLTLYNGQIEMSDRSKDKDGELIEDKEDAAYSLYGTIQYKTLVKYFRPIVESDNGGYDRFMFVECPPHKLRHRTITEEWSVDPAEWNAIIKDLDQMPSGTEYTLSHDAVLCHKEFDDEIIDKRNEDLEGEDFMTQTLARVSQNCLRLALIIHLLNDWHEKEITGEEMDMAVRMARVFYENSRICYNRIYEGEQKKEQQKSLSLSNQIRQYYLFAKMQGQTASDVNQSALAKLYGCSQAYINKVKESLVKEGLIDAGTSRRDNESIEKTTKKETVVSETVPVVEKPLEKEIEETAEKVPTVVESPEERTSDENPSYTQKTSDVKVNPPQDPPKIRSDNDRNPENPENSDISPTPSS